MTNEELIAEAKESIEPNVSNRTELKSMVTKLVNALKEVEQRLDAAENITLKAIERAEKAEAEKRHPP
jgi:methylphosphotriester-DNA--protein-cysteine methyltransferase|tara:strand:- start:7026 stop:7229 length:204 start_codon:yes stop_codon:yes gene_type:complete